MQHLIKSVMVYPPGHVPADWDAPEGYVPEGSIEDYELAFSDAAPAVGQQFEYYGDTWTIAQVQTYCPLETAAAATERFHIASCTWDGAAPARSPWEDTPPILVIHASAGGELVADEASEAAWELVEREEWISPQAGWKIQSLQHFDPVGERLPGDFDTVIVAWSTSAIAEEESPADHAA
jgi:hypothetical protein